MAGNVIHGFLNEIDNEKERRASAADTLPHRKATPTRSLRRNTPAEAWRYQEPHWRDKLLKSSRYGWAIV